MCQCGWFGNELQKRIMGQIVRMMDTTKASF